MTLLTDAGLTIRTLEKIRSLIRIQLHSEVDSQLNLDARTELGQIVDIFARQVRIVEEGLEAVYIGLDPASSSGQMADLVASLVGVTRAAATATRVAATVTIDAGTSFAAGELVAQSTSDPTIKFANVLAVENAGGAPATVPVTYECLTTGPIYVGTGDLEISTPVTGWTAIDNSAPTELGSAVETDAELLARRRSELATEGAGTVDGMRATLLALPGVISVDIVENVSGDTPPNSVMAVVHGPVPATSDDDDAVAQAIWETKAAGIGTHGTGALVTVDAYDSTGAPHAVTFVRAAGLAVSVTVDIETVTGDALSAAKIQELEDEINAAAVPGKDLDWSDIVPIFMASVPQIQRVTEVDIDGTGIPSARATIVAGQYWDVTLSVVATQGIT